MTLEIYVEVHSSAAWTDSDTGRFGRTVVDGRTTRHTLKDGGGRNTAFAPCRCWRCRAGGLPRSDMAKLDQLLARSLAGKTAQEREEWIGAWAMNPNHDLPAQNKLRTWLDIEDGHKRIEPTYSTKAGE